MLLWTQTYSLAPAYQTIFSPPNTETGRAWARIKSGWEMRSRPITFADASIAAAALQLNVPQVTHDASDYGAVENLTILTAPVVR
jgi:predicted nucleic acid-binding protein